MRHVDHSIFRCLAQPFKPLAVLGGGIAYFRWPDIRCAILIAADTISMSLTIVSSDVAGYSKKQLTDVIVSTVTIERLDALLTRHNCFRATE